MASLRFDGELVVAAISESNTIHSPIDPLKAKGEVESFEIRALLCALTLGVMLVTKGSSSSSVHKVRIELPTFPSRNELIEWKRLRIELFVVGMLAFDDLLEESLW